MRILGTITRPMIIGEVLHPAVTGYVVDNLLGGQVPIVLGLTWLRAARVTLDLDRMTCHIRAHGKKVSLHLGNPAPPSQAPTPADLIEYCTTILHLHSSYSPALKQHLQYDLQSHKQIDKALKTGAPYRLVQVRDSTNLPPTTPGPTPVPLHEPYHLPLDGPHGGRLLS